MFLYGGDTTTPSGNGKNIQGILGMSQWQIMSLTFIVKYANVSKSLSLIVFFISFILTGTTSLALNYNSDTKKGKRSIS